jgi:hypothetical protein
LPLDDADLLDRASPITLERTQFDEGKLKARRNGQVKGVLDKGVFGLVVLGGAHERFRKRAAAVNGKMRVAIGFSLRAECALLPY